MIRYNTGAYGLEVLLRLHGSAAYKALTPAILSSLVFLTLYYATDIRNNDPIFDHPYPMSALIAAFTFLLTFKANFSYNRYWEAVGSIYMMHSKWLDVGMDLCAFHLQSDMYKKKPPAFGAYPHYDSSDCKKGATFVPLSKDALEEEIDSHLDANSQSLRTKFQRQLSRLPLNKSFKFKHRTDRPIEESGEKKTIDGSLYPERLPTPFNPVDPRTRKPSPFLQETAHLLSLLSAVALSTLRNDVEAAQSPLATFYRGAPWPAVDPDAMEADIRDSWGNRTSTMLTNVRYLLGLTRSDRDRTIYHAARPFRVIGGVSDGEIELLQAARGPFAKVALVSVWFKEFITREHLQGSTGKVEAPIMSRMYQFTSDGMVAYHQARKVAYIPFPFPHSQITSLFTVIVCIYIPILMLAFVHHPGWGFLLNLLSVMCFAGLHEVARELENPFQNVPNDIPLNNFQAQYNESLMNMFVGYHPDAYWLPEDEEKETISSSGSSESLVEFKRSIFDRNLLTNTDLQVGMDKELVTSEKEEKDRESY